MVADGDRIERDVDDIALAGADLRAARERELALGAEEERVAAEIAALEARRGALKAERLALHDREVADERRIAADTRDIADALGDVAGGSPSAPPCDPPAPVLYKFFVDGKPYETDQPRLTGMQIKAKVHDWDPSHDLVREGNDGAADQVVADGTAVDFTASPTPLHFSSCPKANFGGAR